MPALEIVLGLVLPGLILALGSYLLYYLLRRDARGTAESREDDGFLAIYLAWLPASGLFLLVIQASSGTTTTRVVAVLVWLVVVVHALRCWRLRQRRVRFARRLHQGGEDVSW